MSKSRLDELPGEGEIVILSYNNANGYDYGLGNHIRLFTGYDESECDYNGDLNAYYGALMKLPDWNFKSFAIIRELFPYVEDVFVFTPRFWVEDIRYSKKETEAEGYYTFYCSDFEYSENIREDDFRFAFKVKSDENLPNMTGLSVMDYRVFFDNGDLFEWDYLDDRFVYDDDLDMKPKYEPFKYCYQLSKDELKERKKQFKEYRLNKQICREFDTLHYKLTQCKWYAGYEKGEDFVWAEPENEFEEFPDSEIETKYGDKFYLFKLEKGWLIDGDEGPTYWHKFCKTKEEVIELYNKPLDYFKDWFGVDADAEPFTDWNLGLYNVNSPDWYCNYSWKEYSIGEGVFSVSLIENGPEERKKVRLVDHPDFVIENYNEEW